MILENHKARWAIIILVFLASLAWVLPNFVHLKDSDWWVTKRKLVYGLDIQGGLHLVMGVDVDGVTQQNTKNMVSNLPTELETEKKIVGAKVEAVNLSTGDMKITLPSAEAVAQAVDFIDTRYGSTLQVIKTDGNVIEAAYYDNYIMGSRKQVVERTIETLRNRIDEFGVAEPSIVAQGNDRILIQLPGIQDATNAKALINKAARLDFMIVSQEVNPTELAGWINEAEKAGNYALGKDGLNYSKYIVRLNEDLKAKLPAETRVYFEKPDSVKNLEAGKIPMLLSTKDIVSGAKLRDAVATLDPQRGTPLVSFEFNPDGAREFGALTEKNINRLLAIVLDNVVQSAPVIQSKISGNGQITMGGANPQTAMAEANLISMALRSGALPANLEQLEERTVGPTLGADAISQGQKAGLVGALIVFVFMFLYYKSFGVIANLCIAFNLLLTIAILSGLGATLTLPGVAGLALTIGMAVDANIIINERIKEELRKGASIAMSVNEGYAKAFTAILDGNVTSVAISIVLLMFGTGPVKGFAVSLLIGLICSQFTAVFVSRSFVDLFVQKLKMKIRI